MIKPVYFAAFLAVAVFTWFGASAWAGDIPGEVDDIIAKADKTGPAVGEPTVTHDDKNKDIEIKTWKDEKGRPVRIQRSNSGVLISDTGIGLVWPNGTVAANKVITYNIDGSFTYTQMFYRNDGTPIWGIEIKVDKEHKVTKVSHAKRDAKSGEFGPWIADPFSGLIGNEYDIEGLLPKLPDKTSSSKTSSSETYAMAVRKGEITTKLVSTGETIGVVANVDIHNNTPNEISVTIPATVLVAQDGKSQSYAIPQDETASVPPKGDKIVPLNGVCTEAHRPPVEKGNSTGLAIADPTTPEFKKYEPQLQCTEDVIRVAKEEQKDGKFHTPFSGNPQKELDTIVQQTVWAANPAKDGAATTKEDLAKTVYKQTHATTEEQKKALQPGIDQIWQAVELTGVKAKVLTPQPQT
ncbi:MAG: hypothetical protein PHD76_03855 [Methylacidiphilales bacterium]|nr:hypothetical protein [Candidatus Methylacidiphilales bacterium]